MPELIINTNEVVINQSKAGFTTKREGGRTWRNQPLITLLPIKNLEVS